jgi:hypothetical protein
MGQRLEKRTIMTYIDWKRWGKVAVIAIPVLVWVAWYETLKMVYAGSKWFNELGDEWIEKYLDN